MIFTAINDKGEIKQAYKVKKREVKQYVERCKALWFGYMYCGDKDGSRVYYSYSFPIEKYNEWAIKENQKTRKAVR